MFALYRHTLKYDLIWDTKMFAQDSILLAKDRPLADAFRFGMIHGQLGDYRKSFYYRPIWNLSMMLEHRLWGFRPPGIRLVNIAIFSLSLVFLFVFLKLQDRHEDFPLLGTALFAFLPINADNVVWGVSRCDLFLLLWGLLTLIFFHRHLLTHRRCHWLLAVGFFALGILSKETFLLFVPFMAVYEWAQQRRLSWRRYLGFLGVAAVFFFVKHALLQLQSLGTQALPSLLETIRLLFSTAGYYVRVLLFPFEVSRFTLDADILNWHCLLLGSASFFAAGVFLFRNRRSRNIIPIALTVFFFVPFLWLAISKLWPFRIASRYMMVPAIGVIWLFCSYLGKIKRYLRYLLCGALIVAFLPYLLRSSFSYRNEITYWTDAAQAHPRSSIPLLFLAKTHYNDGNHLLAQYYLKKSLNYPTDGLTASHIAVFYANLEYLRCDYPAALKWLDHPLASSPYSEKILRAMIHLSRGDFKEAERDLLELIRRHPENRLAYQNLMVAYLGHARWEKAAKLEEEMRKIFFEQESQATEKTQAWFLRQPQEQMIAYFSQFRNYRAAIDLIEQKPGRDFADLEMLVELHYRSGRPEIGEKMIGGMLENNRQDHSLCTRIGEFYLKKLNRPEQALYYFERSVRIRPDQPPIRAWIERLNSLGFSRQMESGMPE